MGAALDAGVLLASLSFPPPPDFAAKLGFAPGGRGRRLCLRSDPLRSGAGSLTAAVLRQTLCFSVSPFCVKLQVLGGLGKLRPPGTVLQTGRPGLSVAPPVSPRDREGPREQKPRHPALAVQDAVEEPW